jgi:uncharacterized damage-inducible protein DinB
MDLMRDDTGDQSSGREPLKVYWQPGCTGCLRMKEFLTKHGVAFISINVLTDPEGCEELVRLAGRRVPIARRGNDWVDGQVLSDLARIAGVRLDTRPSLAPAELARRVEIILAAAQRFSAQLPESSLARFLPDRPRRYRDLVAHIAQIIEAFLDLVEGGKRVELAVYEQDAPARCTTIDTLGAYVAGVRRRFDAWWSRHGTAADFEASADVYYGKQTLHEFLERTAWHAGQHARQLQLVLTSLGIAPAPPLRDADFAGLPMPSHVWDSELTFKTSDQAAAIV